MFQVAGRCRLALIAAVALMLAGGCASTMKSLVGQPRTIFIDSNPQGAEVIYDGEPVGTTPTSISFVEGPESAGEHVLEIKLAGFLPYRQTFVDVFEFGYSTDYPREVFANLEPETIAAAAATPAPSSTSGRDEPGVALKPAGQRWAVVVGISTYAHGGRQLPNLKYADRDAEAFYQFLLSPAGGAFPRDHMRFLKNETATLANLRDALFVFLQNAIEEDLVVIYFAGHGAPEPGNKDNLFLLAYDTDPERLASTGFPMWDMDTALRRFIKAERVLLIADACHSAGISTEVASRDLTVEPNPVNRYLSQLANTRGGRAIFTASEAGEQSQESARWGGGHGVFTHFLLEGLKGQADADGNGVVTLGEAIDYTDEMVRRATRNRQHPDTAGNFDRNLPLAILP